MKNNSKRITKKDKENLQVRIIIFAFLGLFVIIAGMLIFNPFGKSTPTAPSLSDNWESLEVNAHKLQNDAYLTNVTINIGKKDIYQFLAEYHSKNQPNSLFSVGITYSGEVNAVPFDDSSLTSSAVEPIFRKDWIIDSQEALDIFAKDEVAASCLKSFDGIIELSLTSSSTFRMFFGENHTTVPIWTLTFWGCPDKKISKDYYLNAKTGEIITQ